MCFLYRRWFIWTFASLRIMGGSLFTGDLQKILCLGKTKISSIFRAHSKISLQVVFAKGCPLQRTIQRPYFYGKPVNGFLYIEYLSKVSCLQNICQIFSDFERDLKVFRLILQKNILMSIEEYLLNSSTSRRPLRGVKDKSESTFLYFEDLFKGLPESFLSMGNTSKLFCS